jgi:hypothetical protein
MTSPSSFADLKSCVAQQQTPTFTAPCDIVSPALAASEQLRGDGRITSETSGEPGFLGQIKQRLIAPHICIASGFPWEQALRSSRPEDLHDPQSIAFS